jgi:hypothetical protein
LRRIEAKAKGIFLDQKKNGQVMDISAWFFLRVW